MKVLVMYDIDTTSTQGRKRLLKIAKKCLDRGVRIQNSVYECELNATQLRELQTELKKMIDPAVDCIHIFNMGNSMKDRCTCLGKNNSPMKDAYLI